MIIQEQYNKLHKLVIENPTKDYRNQINDAITLLDTTNTTRTFSYIKKNTDLLIKSLDLDISMREFMRSKYNTAPYIKSGENLNNEFLFYMRGLGGKHIQYPIAYIESIGFWFSLLHECAHAKDYIKDSKNRRELSEEDAITTNEKSARTQGYHIAQQFYNTYNINLLEDFSSIEYICMYANIHLLLSTYPRYKTDVDVITLTSADFL